MVFHVLMEDLSKLRTFQSNRANTTEFEVIYLDVLIRCISFYASYFCAQIRRRWHAASALKAT